MSLIGRLAAPVRRRRRAIGGVSLMVLVVAVAGCDREPRASGANDTVATDVPAIRTEDSTPPPPVSTNGWRLEEAGPALVLPAKESALQAQLVLPQHTDSTLTSQATFDLAPLRGRTLELFGPAGLVG